MGQGPCLCNRHSCSYGSCAYAPSRLLSVVLLSCNYHSRCRNTHVTAAALADATVGRKSSASLYLPNACVGSEDALAQGAPPGARPPSKGRLSPSAGVARALPARARRRQLGGRGGAFRLVLD